MEVNIPRRLLGRYVEVQWKDPTFGKGDITTELRGRAALSTWLERGVLVDVTDGVVRIEHSLAAGPGRAMTEPDERACTSVPEELIESLSTFTRDEGGGRSESVV
jgi:hypothetical protein